jgi:uncharacterized membrane protein YfcA
VSVLEALAILLAGVVAGAVNTVVGSGTLLTFPILLGFGYSPVTANVTNTIGLVPGSLSGAYGYRAELSGQRGRIVRLGVFSLLGGLTGAIGLLLLPASAFKTIVPVFIGLALVLVVLQPLLAKRLAARPRAGPERSHPVVAFAVFLSGVYGGYFGAAQGIMMLAILGLALTDDLHRINALKNVLVMIVNLVAGVVFIFAAHVAWAPALLLMGGATVGGQLGARYGRRLPQQVLRGLIIVVGIIAIVRLV